MLPTHLTGIGGSLSYLSRCQVLVGFLLLPDGGVDPPTTLVIVHCARRRPSDVVSPDFRLPFRLSVLLFVGRFAEKGVLIILLNTH